MNKYKVAVLSGIIVFLLVLTQISIANILVNQLGVSSNSVNPGTPVTIFYNLNEDATSIVIDILSGSSVVRTLNTGDENPPITAGYNNIVWDLKDNGGLDVPIGTYSFRVIADDNVGHSVWERISAVTTANTAWASANGVAVNNNTTSSRFGYVYVAVGSNNFGFSSTTSVFGYQLDSTRDQGVWWYKDPGLRSAPISGTYDMDTGLSSIFDPMGIRVGNDDRIYVSNHGLGGVSGAPNDWVVVGDSDFSSGGSMILLDRSAPSSATTTFDQFGGVFYHFDLLETSTSRYLIFADNGRSGLTFSWPLRFYDVGAANSLVTTEHYPNQILSANTALQMYVTNAADSIGGGTLSQTGPSHDNNGNIYWTNRRFTTTTTAAGNVVLLSSISGFDDTVGRWFISSLAGVQSYDLTHDAADLADGDIDGFMGFQTLVDNRPGKEKVLLALAWQTGRVYLFGLDSTKIDTSPADGKNDYFDTGLAGLNSTGTNSGVDIDIVGNIYVTDSNADDMFVFSPPDGPNSFTLSAPASAEIDVVPTYVDYRWDIFN